MCATHEHGEISALWIPWILASFAVAVLGRFSSLIFCCATKGSVVEFGERHARPILTHPFVQRLAQHQAWLAKEYPQVMLAKMITPVVVFILMPFHPASLLLLFTYHLRAVLSMLGDKDALSTSIECVQIVECYLFDMARCLLIALSVVAVGDNLGLSWIIGSLAILDYILNTINQYLIMKGQSRTMAKAVFQLIGDFFFSYQLYHSIVTIGIALALPPDSWVSAWIIAPHVILLLANKLCGYIDSLDCTSAALLTKTPMAMMTPKSAGILADCMQKLGNSGALGSLITDDFVASLSGHCPERVNTSHALPGDIDLTDIQYMFSKLMGSLMTDQQDAEEETPKGEASNDNHHSPYVDDTDDDAVDDDGQDDSPKVKND